MSRKRRRRSRPRANATVPPKPPAERPPTHRLRMWCWRVVISIYVMWILVIPPSGLAPAVRDVWSAPQDWLRGLLNRGLAELGFDTLTRFELGPAYYVAFALIVPYLACLLLGRGRPADTGWRKPNRYFFRIVGCSFLAAIPFLWWMVNSPEFEPYYRSYLRQGAGAIIRFYVLLLFCEHCFFEGVMLAAFRADGRWPAPAPVLTARSAGWRRLANWFGVACPIGSARGVHRVTRWLGLPDGCVGTIILSGVLFGLVHWGKAGREFLLAFPGGIFLAGLAYRCNSWHAPYLLHAGTVTAAAVMFLAMQK